MTSALRHARPNRLTGGWGCRRWPGIPATSASVSSGNLGGSSCTGRQGFCLPAQGGLRPLPLFVILRPRHSNGLFSSVGGGYFHHGLALISSCFLAARLQDYGSGRFWTVYT
ncbi:hypothetical protein CKAH01_07722 [Colletotrichum kahawae]|uniref:Uncharacterized protein n=1 Tax=Colletotrichum kahawae TaxID=34407 RepID=A0AAD9Y6L0_COLKA|nr:hypothetical protein CKAH01_07722 [Colletotrichum kahawae]